MGHLRVLTPRLDQTFDGLIGVDCSTGNARIRPTLSYSPQGLPADDRTLGVLTWNRKIVNGACSTDQISHARAWEVLRSQEKAHLGGTAVVDPKLRSGTLFNS